MKLLHALLTEISYSIGNCLWELRNFCGCQLRSHDFHKNDPLQSKSCFQTSLSLFSEERRGLGFDRLSCRLLNSHVLGQDEFFSRFLPTCLLLRRNSEAEDEVARGLPTQLLLGAGSSALPATCGRSSSDLQQAAATMPVVKILVWLVRALFENRFCSQKRWVVFGCPPVAVRREARWPWVHLGFRLLPDLTCRSATQSCCCAYRCSHLRCGLLHAARWRAHWGSK